ncbi:uncharacterized protein RSE6_09598 [Rhynchosporium secalis]|uniref:Uncharacterized protein n=1 Tax=Rhynchosporium secalis TaxID=38038 RepID=A0A1E1MI95_RHYSE|nr:uncharacterized protein RSE6_09598 [Rhynchosporium secalis]
MDMPELRSTKEVCYLIGFCTVRRDGRDVQYQINQIDRSDKINLRNKNIETQDEWREECQAKGDQHTCTSTLLNDCIHYREREERRPRTPPPPPPPTPFNPNFNYSPASASASASAFAFTPSPTPPIAEPSKPWGRVLVSLAPRALQPCPAPSSLSQADRPQRDEWMDLRAWRERERASTSKYPPHCLPPYLPTYLTYMRLPAAAYLPDLPMKPNLPLSIWTFALAFDFGL